MIAVSQDNTKEIKVLNLLTGGNVGGIEELCKNIGLYADCENTFCFLFKEGVIFKEMKNNGNKVISLANCGKRKWSIKRFVSLYKLAKNYNIVVRHHCAKAINLYYILIGYMLKSKKMVMTVHSCFEKKYNYPHKYGILNLPEKILLRLAIRISDRFIFVSEAGRNSYMKEFDIDKGMTRVIFNGINPTMIRAEAEISAYVPDIFQMVYIGRLVEIKGVHLLIDAVNILRNQYNINTKLSIVGYGACKNILEKQVNDLDLNSLVTFEGMQRNIGKYLQTADIFVYPSICQEVFGISIVEALAYGVPCVAFKVGGIPEIISSGFNGFLATDITADNLAGGIRQVIEMYKSEEIQNIKKNCLKTANQFSITNTISELDNYYKNILGEIAR